MNHTQTTNKLKKVMMEEFISVHQSKNPLAIRLNTIPTTQLQYVLSQYTIFPRKIVSFLFAARKVAEQNGWQEVVDELTRNIGEELGTQTNGVTHYKMLIKGLAQGLDLKLEDQLLTLKPSTATKAFIKRITAIMSNENPVYALGGAYALETSAVPELVIVMDAVNKFFMHLTGHGIPKENILTDFFHDHLGTWEPGHEEGLRDTTEKHIDSEQKAMQFEQGFKDVMEVMDQWWTSLYEESKEQ